MSARIRKELAKVDLNDKDVSITFNESDIYSIKGYIKGAPGTLYEGGTFELDIKLPQTYPFDPPDIRFVTPIWHPNISSQTGVICLDILKPGKWTPALNIRSALISILSLLNEPVPDDPQDGVVASQLLNNKPEFEETARYWTQVFAKGATTS